MEKDKQEVDESRVLRFNDVTSETVFTRLLVEAEETSSYATFFHHVKSMSPSALDFELRSLDHRNDFDLLRKLLRAIHAQMATSRDFELLQSYLAIVLKIHGDLILANPDSFYEELAVLLERQREQWSTLEELFQKSLCLVDFIRNV